MTTKKKIRKTVPYLAVTQKSSTYFVVNMHTGVIESQWGSLEDAVSATKSIKTKRESAKYCNWDQIENIVCKGYEFVKDETRRQVAHYLVNRPEETETVTTATETVIEYKSKTPRPMSIFQAEEVLAAEQACNKYFYKMSDMFRSLAIGCLSGKNVFLYGPGGHAKSMGAERFFSELGVKPFVQSCGDGLTEEKLYGGIDMVKFKEDGTLSYNVEQSFMAHEVVIFEELLDAPINVLLSLKDILTSGWLRQGSQQYEIQTQIVVCLTNRSKEEVEADDSIAALLDRFPVEQQVKWDSYEAEDYSKLFDCVLSSEDREEYKVEFGWIAKLAEQAATSSKIISPRTAIHCAEIVVSTGSFQAVKYVAGIDKEDVDLLIASVKREQQDKKERSKLEDLNSEAEAYYQQCAEGNLEPSDCVEKMRNILKVLDNMTVGDSQIRYMSETANTVHGFITAIKSLES